MPFFDFLKPKKRSSRHGEQHPQKEIALPAQPSSDNNNPSGNARVSKRSAKEDRSMMPDVTQLSVMQPSTVTAIPTTVQVTKKREKRRKEEDKFHKPIVQRADDVRTKTKVDLHVEELHWHSGGVFSNVYRGKLTAPEKMEIAIKKTWPKDSVRSDEMIILAAMRRANPRNVIKLLYIFKNTAPDSTDCEAFVFAYMPETLDKVIKRGLNTIDMKIYIWQLFNGLDFLAANRIAHRDVKPINILVNKDTGELQIGDFGSAKVISSRDKSSAYQVTRYYRPPEMLLGSNHYSHKIDVWSAGCVLGEMIKGRVLFRGSDSENQMQLIQAAFGAPNEQELKAMKVNTKTVKLANVIKLGLLVSLRLQSDPSAEPPRLPASTAQAIALLRKILVYQPELRLCGKAFLEDPFFDDVLSPNCVRENGRKPDLQRQSDDTMGHNCFEKSQKSVRDSRVSRMAEPPAEETQVSTKHLDKTDSNKHESEETATNDKKETVVHAM